MRSAKVFDDKYVFIADDIGDDDDDYVGDHKRTYADIKLHVDDDD